MFWATVTSQTSSEKSGRTDIQSNRLLCLAQERDSKRVRQRFLVFTPWSLGGGAAEGCRVPRHCAAHKLIFLSGVYAGVISGLKWLRLVSSTLGVV